MSLNNAPSDDRREPQNEPYAKSVSIAKKLKPQEFPEQEIREEHKNITDDLEDEKKH